MKSLEIVNSVIRVCKAEDTAIGLLYIENLEQIKDDLEVLEIIKNKKVDVPLLERIIKGHSFNQAILDIYNLATSSQLTLEELLKLKRWLEEQE